MRNKLIMFLESLFVSVLSGQNKSNVFLKVRPKPARTKLENPGPISNFAAAFLVLVGKSNRNLIKFLGCITVTQ